MLAPKDLLDALSGHASRLFSGDTPLPRNEIESQFKALLQSGFSKLDLVSRWLLLPHLLGGSAITDRSRYLVCKVFVSTDLHLYPIKVKRRGTSKVKFAGGVVAFHHSITDS